MVQTREQTIEKLIDIELANAVHGKNWDVYEKRLLDSGHPDFKYVPRCIYFYYVRVDKSGKIRIDNYFYCDGPYNKPHKWKRIHYCDVPKILKKLALNGRPSGRKVPPRRSGATFEDVIWTRRSYVAIYFDEAHWSFHKRSNGLASVVFNVTGGGAPNGAFFDAKDLTLLMPNNYTGKKDKRTAIFMVNHMKDENGDLGEVDLNYKFDMYMKVKYSKTDETTMTVILDPGGTNQGPPEQP